MTAFNVVRFRVKPGREADFVAYHQQRVSFAGARRLTMIKTGERSYCLIGEWNSMDAIVAARPQMIATLDGTREMLEDLGNGLGVTDPVSGETVLEVRLG